MVTIPDVKAGTTTPPMPPVVVDVLDVVGGKDVDDEAEAVIAAAGAVADIDVMSSGSSTCTTLEDSEIAKNAAAISAIEKEEEDLARAIRETERSELTDDTEGEGDGQSETSSTTGPPIIRRPGHDVMADSSCSKVSLDPVSLDHTSRLVCRT